MTVVTRREESGDVISTRSYVRCRTTSIVMIVCVRDYYDEIFYYIRNNIDDIKDDLVWMVSGESVEIKLQGYAVTDTELSTKNQIYSATVVNWYVLPYVTSIAWNARTRREKDARKSG